MHRSCGASPRPNQREKETGARVRYQKVSESSDQELDADQIEAGYEISKRSQRRSRSLFRDKERLTSPSVDQAREQTPDRTASRSDLDIAT
jgi:hypothetical protein